MAAFVMMRMSGRRKLRRLLQHLLLPRVTVRDWDATPAWGM
jgi:hypothetical protein